MDSGVCVGALQGQQGRWSHGCLLGMLAPLLRRIPPRLPPSCRPHSLTQAPMGGWGTVLVAAFYPSLYIAPLYCCWRLPRDSPRGVWARMAAALAASTALGWVPLALELQQQREAQASRAARVAAAAAARAAGSPLLQTPPLPPQAAQHPSLLLLLARLAAALGLRRAGLLSACTLPLALTASLFLGPLLLLAGERARGTPLRALLQLPPGPATLRNLVAAPLTEELVFRGCLLPHLLLRGLAPPAAAWLAPALFGAAHLHHAHRLVAREGWPARRALAAATFQAAYTTVFGAYASLLLLRTGHLAAPILAHALCNLLGLPPVGRLARRPALAAATVGGVAAFAALLRPLTSPRLFGYSPGDTYVTELLHASV